MSEALFTIKLDVEDAYKPLIEDILKFSSVFFVGILVFCMSYGSMQKAQERLLLDIYSVSLLGLTFYHLIFKYLVSFDL